MNRLYMAIFYTIKYWMNIKDTYNGQMLDLEEQKKKQSTTKLIERNGQLLATNEHWYKPNEQIICHYIHTLNMNEHKGYI